MKMTVPEQDEFDVVVIGSGAAGLACALTAAAHGFKVAVLEKDRWLGGTSATSGGWLWIPGNHLARAEGIEESPQRVREYLRNELGEFYDEDRVSAFLDHGPLMVDFLMKRQFVAFESGSVFPDYHPSVPGASKGGRAIRTADVSVSQLGPAAALVRPLLKELTFVGLGIGSGSDMKHFSRAMRSPVSMFFVLGRIARYFYDWITAGRSHRMVNGNSLIGQLVCACQKHRVQFFNECAANALQSDAGRIVGVDAEFKGTRVSLKARRAVVLASGGFGHSPEWRAEFFPHVRRGAQHLCLSPQTVSGDGLRMATAVGAATDGRTSSPALYAPVSQVRRGIGAAGLYPHFADRGKPGVIAVRTDGRRFVNESNSYHDVVTGLLNAPPIANDPPFAFLICDARALRRYGLGLAKPFPVPVQPHLRSGYLMTGDSVRDLALAAGIEPMALESTIERFNEGARAGVDPDFGKGANRYNHFQGDLDHFPNPCLAPLDCGPYYAVKFHAGDLGTSVGLHVNSHSQVLDRSGETIAGLYAAGNDTTGLMRGFAPGAGITLGPAMTSGFVAALHACGVSLTPSNKLDISTT